MQDSQQNMNGLQGDILAETSEERHADNPQSQQLFTSTAGISAMDPQKRNNITLSSVLAVGLICVYMLSVYSGPQQTQGATADAVKQHVDSALQNISKPLPDEQNIQTPTALEMLDKVFSEILDRQITQEYLKDNPFVFKVPNPSDSPKDNNRSNPIVTIKALTGLEGLKLESVVLAGDNSFAVISGRLLNLNQKINGWKVVEIRPGNIVLSRGKDKFEMIMQER